MLAWVVSCSVWYGWTVAALCLSRDSCSSWTFGAWDDPNHYAGFVPSHTYFRGFYDCLIKRYTRQIDQKMGMNPLHKASIDHSHKVYITWFAFLMLILTHAHTNRVDVHLLKFNGMWIFGSLHMTVNERSEVWAWTLTLTKGQDQCMPSITAIPHSLWKYWHDDTEITFTDNLWGNKAKLEQAIPTPHDHVVPVLSSSMEQLVLPDDWKNQVFILEMGYQVNTHLNRLKHFSLSQVHSDTAIPKFLSVLVVM
jgi:hypothetical protein